MPSKITLKVLFRKQHGLCHYCKAVMHHGKLDRSLATLDHVIPKSQGGTRHYKNAVAACWACNNARGNAPYDVFVRQVNDNGRPDNKPTTPPHEWLKNREDKAKRRELERAIMNGTAKWTAKMLADRPYIHEITKFPSLGEALAAALKEKK